MTTHSRCAYPGQQNQQSWPPTPTVTLHGACPAGQRGWPHACVILIELGFQIESGAAGAAHSSERERLRSSCVQSCAALRKCKLSLGDSEACGDSAHQRVNARVMAPTSPADAFGRILFWSPALLIMRNQPAFFGNLSLTLFAPGGPIKVRPDLDLPPYIQWLQQIHNSLPHLTPNAFARQLSVYKSFNTCSL